MDNLTFKGLRNLWSWKQEYFGMLFGMGKQSVSRFETGERKETLVHNEMLSLVAFIDEKDLLKEYVKKRFGVNISRRYYKNGTPMADLKYIKKYGPPEAEYK
jgi:hypothetical protein